jgi:type VI secretion system VgrG family protein
MKKLIVCTVLLSVVIIAGRAAHHVIVDAQGAPSPSGNGDVNGDGARDISDGIYLLNWLFTGGPEPVAIAGSPELEGRVSDLETALAALQASGGATAAALESLALALGDGAIADAVPPSALQPLDSARPLALYLDGDLFGEPMGAHIVEAVSALPVAHVAVRIDAPVVETDSLLGLPARLEFEQQGGTNIFAGEVIAAAHAGRQGEGAILRISVAPGLHRLSRGRKSKTYEKMSDPDVVRRVLADHGVPNLWASTLPSIRREFIVQYQESDFDFISRLLEEEGIYFFIEHGPDGDMLRIASDSTAAPEIPGVFEYRGHQAVSSTPGEAYVHTFHAAARPVPATVQVSGWDYVAKQRFTSSEATGSGGGLEDVFLGEGNALEVQSDAIGRRKSAIAASHPVLGTSTISMLRPGSTASVRGVGGSFDGKYYVTSVRHTWVRPPSGGQTQYLYGNAFTCIPAAVPFSPERRTGASKIYGIQPAIVTDNKDPDRLGRVKVKFPWLDNGGTEAGSKWVRMTQLGAGKDRGFFCLPEVDDEVLVAFTHGDPARPVIVGSLWNGKDTPPREGEGKNDVRLWKSRSGHTLLFDDTDSKEKVSIRAVTTPGEASEIGLEADSTQVTGVLSLSSNAGPGRAVHPGEHHRDNAIVAWARVSPAGAVVGDASFGVAQVRRVRPGAYTVTLAGSARSEAELIPMASAETDGPPLTQEEMRIATVTSVDATSFGVFIVDGLAEPVDGAFVILVTAR